MIKIVVFCIVTVLLAVVFKKYNSMYSVLISIAGCVFVFLMIAEDFFSIVSKVSSLASDFSYTYSYIKLMIKTLGICIITQIVSDMCIDAGEKAMSTIVETGAKVTIIAMMMPLFETLVNIISGIVK